MLQSIRRRDLHHSPNLRSDLVQRCGQVSPRARGWIFHTRRNRGGRGGGEGGGCRSCTSKAQARCKVVETMLKPRAAGDVQGGHHEAIGRGNKFGYRRSVEATVILRAYWGASRRTEERLPLRQHLVIEKIEEGAKAFQRYVVNRNGSNKDVLGHVRHVESQHFCGA